MDYRKAYALLMGSMSSAIDEMEKCHVITQEMKTAMQMLKDGLEKVEEMYLSSDE